MPTQHTRILPFGEIECFFAETQKHFFNSTFIHQLCCSRNRLISAASSASRAIRAGEARWRCHGSKSNDWPTKWQTFSYNFLKSLLFLSFFLQKWKSYRKANILDWCKTVSFQKYWRLWSSICRRRLRFAKSKQSKEKRN